MPLCVEIMLYGSDDRVQELYRICWRKKGTTDPEKQHEGKPLMSTRGEIKQVVAELNSFYPLTEYWYETGLCRQRASV